MCGIVGALSLGSGFRISEEYISRMRDAMPHRGPDGAGTWVSDDCRIGLGHRRLSIIDLSPTANQPMSNEDGSLWVVFNGEIYNHAEIRTELERLGRHRWKTDHSDTEVILHAFEEWGIQCLHRFRGMFALALWDSREQALWLIRDRIGIKPLYYSIHHGRITFASEIKALLKDPQQARSVNEAAFFHYLSFLTTPAPETLFLGIRKLPSGTWLRVAADGSTREQRWWDVLGHTTPLTGVSEDEIAQRLLAELRTAVQLHKVSDVPVGVFLSGGIDSSTNAALFSEGERRPVKTFSIGYQGEYRSYRNELHHARRMAEAVKADHHERLLTQDDLLDFLPQMVCLQDEPIADPVCVPVYYLSKLAREHGVVVAQVGEGADELFWGYPAWKTALSLQRYDDLPLPGAIKRLGLGALRAVGKGQGMKYEWLRRGAAGQPIFWGGAEGFSHAEKVRLLSPRLRRALAGLTSWEAVAPIRARFEAMAREPTRLNWMTYLDLNLRLPELLLMRVDKMSMGVSLEGRVPFLDHKVVELAMAIPERIKTRHGTLKHILKKAVRGLIPDEITDRPKQGFGVPVHEWLCDRLGEQARRDLDRFCRETDFLDRAEVLRLFDRGEREKIWYLLNFALWWQAAVTGEQTRLPGPGVPSPDPEVAMSAPAPTATVAGLRVVNVGLFPPPFGGVSIHLQRLMQRLQAARADCLLIDLSGRAKRQAGVVPWSWGAAILRLMVTRRSIVHFHNFSPRNTLFFWILSLRHRTILSLHNERFLDQLEQLSPIGRRVATALLSQLDRIVVDSQKSWRLAQRIVSDPARISLIPEFLEPAAIPVLTHPQVLRLRSGHRFLIASNAFQIEFHNGEDLYGLDLLVELMRRLVHVRKLDAALAFLLPAIGDPDYYAKVRQEVERHGLTDRILFVTEPLEEAASLWRVSDVVVRATNTDGNSISVMEALSVGAPVVASDCVDRPEGVVSFATRDIDDLEAKVVDVLARNGEYRRRVAALPPLDNGARFLELYRGMGMRGSL